MCSFSNKSGEGPQRHSPFAAHRPSEGLRVLLKLDEEEGSARCAHSRANNERRWVEVAT